jgi:RNA polymerase sigma factor (TIGR02999 family)
MDADPGDVTALLDRYRRGDTRAEAELFSRLYDELHRLAAIYMRRERAGHPLQTTALVNEAYVRLVGQRLKTFANREHFIAVSATIMRQILVDVARRAKRQKRDLGASPQPLEDWMASVTNDPDLVLDIDAALRRLADSDERQARIVELRYFVGLSVEEAADLLQVSARTVKREWTMARAWLRGELATTPQAPDGSGV